MSEIFRLGDKVAIKTGYPFKSAGFTDIPSDVRLLRGDNVGQGRLRWYGAKRWPASESKLYEEFCLETGDIILAMDRPWIETGLKYAEVRAEDLPCLLVQRVARLRAQEGLDQRFLGYLIRSRRFTEYIVGTQTGTAIPHISGNQIADFRFSCPDLPSQQAIAGVLGVLDDKFSLNERLVEISTVLVKDMLANLWCSLGVTSLTADSGATVAAVRRTTLGDLCAAGGGGIQTGPFGSQLHASDYVESGVPSVMPQNIGNNYIVEDGIARVSQQDARRLSRYALLEGDIVYSRRGDIKRRALVRSAEAGWLCGTGCLRARVGNAVEPLLISYYLGESEIQEWIARHAVGATMPNLNTSILASVPVVLPSKEVRQRLNSTLSAIDGRAAHAIRENRTLAALRDTLLPELMSGRLRVRDAERVVEDAT